MLATLYAKALDAAAEHPVLGDPFAKDLVGRIDYDWRETTITARSAPQVTVRTAYLDNWARQFLAVNNTAVVLHVGCGLDSRVFRLDPKSGIQWYDIDYPDVIALRTQLYPARENYHMVPVSVTEPKWLTTIAPDRPALMIAEGLTMYLTEQDGVALLRRVVERFPSGELQFDVFNRFAIRSQKINGAVRRSGSILHWGVDRPDDLVQAVPGVRLLAAVSAFDTDTFRRVRPAYRMIGRIMSLVPALGTMQQFYRYAF
jgi:methyltransferase (TIGR00027 family)